MDPQWMELLNSDYHDYRGKSNSQDRLDNDKWISTFLSQWQLSKGNIQISTLRKSLHDLRNAIRKIVDATVAQEPADPADWKKLNSVLSAAPVKRRLEISTAGVTLFEEPLQIDEQSILAEITMSFIAVFIDGDPSRIRICENDDCRWVFYDTTRSRTRRWCDDSSCGNLMKVRRFRERQKNSKR